MTAVTLKQAIEDLRHSFINAPKGPSRSAIGLWFSERVRLVLGELDRLTAMADSFGGLGSDTGTPYTHTLPSHGPWHECETCRGEGGWYESLPPPSYTITDVEEPAL